ncbi:hypothetical protein NHL50_12490 [Acidimicrobiia bacterium EGI L10123]|uniref:BTAD domain-containing putative transcriptional regulator n=1 Tax=Salinilacustrithrix flava TaxID=2957203 RepID=UPI003D7C1C97|nr:hypothetical protein [Acidimicrobiia bacterium EGI L10123]
MDGATSDGHVVEVWPGDEPVAWSGLAAILASCRAARTHLVVPAALEAATTGRPVGDHLGLAGDLCSLLARMGEERSWTLLVHDAHRFDLSSAAALSHALALEPAGVRAVGTDDRVEPVRHEAGPIEDARRRAHDAARLGGMLDAAAASEVAGDWAAAAGRWLEGGRPDRCRRAIALAGPDPHAAEVAARLAHRTGSVRERRAATRHALSVLESSEPLAAVRLLLLEASSGGDGSDDVLDAAAALLATVDPTPPARATRDLHALAVATAAVGCGGDPEALRCSIERPLARLGAGGIDPDAVHLLTAAARVLGWQDHLEEARSLLDRVIGVLDARRRFVLLAQPLATSAWLSRRRGRLELALTHGSRAIQLARSCGWSSDERLATVEVAHVEAMRGHLEECRRHVATLVPAGSVPRGSAQVGAVSALAVAELLADDPQRAVELLEPVQACFGDAVAPAEVAWRHNLVEAYVRTGRRADAEAVLDDLVGWAARADSTREQGQVAWCRGMLAPAGDHDAHFTEARRLLEPYPTLRWRSDLHHLRRLLDEGRHGAAAAVAERLVSDARSAGLLGAVDQVHRLQRAHGIPVPDPVPSTSALSVEDLRVALALAEGADAEEIAALLQLTPRAVEVVRDRVMALLGVDAPEHLAGFLPPARSAPVPVAALVRVLGPTVVQRGAQQLVPPDGRPAAVLALVATEGAVPVERVLEVLWPEVEPTRSRARLRNVLARLRAATGPVIERAGDRLVLAAGVEVDAHRFDRLVDQALRAPADEALAPAAEALAAWQGEPLPAWPYEDWALRERHRLVQRCVAVHVRRAEILTARGAVGAALDELELAVGLQPDARDLWERAVHLAEGDERVGRARALRRRAADHDVELR